MKTPSANSTTAACFFPCARPSGSNGQRAWIHYTPGGTIAHARRLMERPLPPAHRAGSRLPGQRDPVDQQAPRRPKELVVFGNPASSSSRTSFTLRVSPDGGDTWPVSRLLYAGSGAYSSICILPDKSIGVLLEKDNYTKITFARVEEAWLMNPDNDSDNDGMPDAWEILHGLNAATHDALSDNDGDGTPNLDEYLAGTDPLDRTSRFEVSQISLQSGIRLDWSSVPGRSYIIEESNDLLDWQTVPVPAITANGASASATVPFNGSVRRFFRISVLP